MINMSEREQKWSKDGYTFGFGLGSAFAGAGFCMVENNNMSTRDGVSNDHFINNSVSSSLLTSFNLRDLLLGWREWADKNYF